MKRPSGPRWTGCPNAPGPTHRMGAGIEARVREVDPGAVSQQLASLMDAQAYRDLVGE